MSDNKRTNFAFNSTGL